MIETYGPTHIALKVKDLEKSKLFYGSLPGAGIMYQSDGFIQIQTPNTKDIILPEKAEFIDNMGWGIIHFGFRLRAPTDINVLVEQVTRAGGRIKEKGEFVPGEPYVFAYDPDVCEIEIWYEKIPPDLSNFT